MLSRMELFEDQVWQMAYGERAAIEGLLAARPPALAIEIGTAEGASLRRIARHAAEVHSFDLVEPVVSGIGEHVHLHTGDSHVLLPEVLARFAAAGRNVDFVLVDGDHSADGVRRDLEDLLASPAIVDTVIVTHDTGNERVRAGLDAVPYGAYPKVAHVDLDFVPGHLGQDRFPGELWYGLGLVVVDAGAPSYGEGPPVQTDRRHGGQLLAIARDVLGGRPPAPGDDGAFDVRSRQLSDAFGRIDDLEGRHWSGVAEREDLRRRVDELTAEAERHLAIRRAVMASPSWRITAPLRAAKRLALGRVGRR